MPKTNIEQLKEKWKLDFYEYTLENHNDDVYVRVIDILSDWWFSKIDQAVTLAIQDRNEEVVELIKKELSIMETKEQDEGLLFDGDVGYVVGLNKAINLISPSNKGGNK